MNEFSDYTNIFLSALKSNPRAIDIIAKKKEILESVYSFHNLSPQSTLFVGFNPAILASKSKITVTAISESALNYLKEMNIKFEVIDFQNILQYKKKFDSVVALDEFFTFSASDEQQQNNVKAICNAAKEVVISTIKDYKNQEYKDKEFSIPALIRKPNENLIYMEFNDWNHKDRSAWTTKSFEIEDSTNSMKVYGPYDRRTMYFKQLARFSMDNGATHFQVHKNLMYKSINKKNYEHVISIIFE